MNDPEGKDAPDLATLNRLVELKAPEAGSGDALKELARLDGAEPLGALGRVLGDRAFPETMRSTAAVALGRRTGAEAERRLVAALADPAPAVVRRAAEGLGRMGGPDALKALEMARPPDDPAARRALLFARRLAAARHGAPARAEAIGAKLQPLAPQQATSLEPRPADRHNLDLLRLSLAEELPALPVRLEGAVQLTCGANRFLVLPHQDAARAGRGSFVPAVVLKRAQALDRYALYLYVLSTPRDARTLQLEGFRPDGSLACLGEARLGDGAPKFTLGALDTPLVPPIRVEGQLAEAGHLVLSRADVGPPDRRAGPRARTPAPAPLASLKPATRAR